MKLARPNGCLKFEFCGNGHEYDHLRRPNMPLGSEVARQITALHSEGKSQRQIATQLNISRSSVVRVLDKVKEASS